MDQATCLSGPRANPQSGDVTICIRCAAVLVFNHVGVEAPDEDGLQELLKDQRIVQARALVQRMNSIRRTLEAVV